MSGFDQNPDRQLENLGARNLDDLRRLGKSLTGRGVRIQFVKEQLTFTGGTRRWRPLDIDVG